MAYCKLAILCIAVTSVLAAPADNDQLDKSVTYKKGSIIDLETIRKYRKFGYYLNDKATVNDVAVNTVSEEKKLEIAAVPGSSAPQSTVQISGITTGAIIPPGDINQDNQPFKPQRAGSMFARFIDDIFQIPINVLQNVARLITSPFTTAKKTPEVVAVVS